MQWLQNMKPLIRARESKLLRRENGYGVSESMICRDNVYVFHTAAVNKNTWTKLKPNLK